MTYRCALITGASNGIGRALAEALPPQTGLLLSGRDRAALDELAAKLAEPGRTVEVITADLSGDPGRDALIAAAEAAEIDLLINNAGLGHMRGILDNSPEQEREMVEVNVVAPVVLTRSLLPGMIARVRNTRHRAGVVIVASVAGYFTMPYLTTYAASKSFDLRYGEGLAAELAGLPVDVLTVCPGSTETRFAERAAMHPKLMEGAHSAEQVARETLRALGKRSVHIVGEANWLRTMAPRVLPRGFLTNQTANIMRRMMRS